MPCDLERSAFEEKMRTVQEALQNDLKQIADDTERKASEIANSFDADNDLAEGVGAVAGTVIGGVIGGPVGAGTGAYVGRTIGSLFVIEIGMHRQDFALDVPQVAMRAKQVSFDVPTVQVNDKDIIFDIPGMEMRRVDGPPIPKTTIRMRNKCIRVFGKKMCTKVPETVIEWEPSSYDIPVPVMKKVRIVIGIPEVRMDRQDLSLDLPEFKVDRTSFSFDVPAITIRFLKDAGKRVTAAAAALAQSAQEAALRKQLEFKEKLRIEVAPFALSMFACFRKGVQDERDGIAGRYDPEIEKLSAVVTAIAAKGVSEDDSELKKTRIALDEAKRLRDEAVAPFDQALAKLDAETKKAMDQFLTGDFSDAGEEPSADGDTEDDEEHSLRMLPLTYTVA